MSRIDLVSCFPNGVQFAERDFRLPRGDERREFTKKPGPKTGLIPTNFDSFDYTTLVVPGMATL